MRKRAGAAVSALWLLSLGVGWESRGRKSGGHSQGAEMGSVRCRLSRKGERPQKVARGNARVLKSDSGSRGTAGLLSRHLWSPSSRALGGSPDVLEQE